MEEGEKDTLQNSRRMENVSESSSKGTKRRRTENSDAGNTSSSLGTHTILSYSTPSFLFLYTFT